MNTFKLLLIAMLTAVVALAIGCGNDESDPEDSGPGGDGDPDGGDTVDPDLSECPKYPDNTCAAVIAAGEPERCVADFNYGSCQAGNSGECADYCGYDKFVGVYGYNDTTEGASQIPKPNFTGSEAATKIKSCDPVSDDGANYALHFEASGFTDWGAGIGMDWGGPFTEWCDDTVHPRALECLYITQEDPKYTVEEAMLDERCARPNDPDEDHAMRQCLMWGKNEKRVRDLSAYVGIGFWVLTMDDHEAAQVKVNFPIPATTRFYGNELIDGDGCSDDDEPPPGETDPNANQCFNDYAKYLNFNPQDRGKWVYKEVLFTQLEWSEDWGLQLDDLGYEKFQFPKTESIGLKWQIDRNIAFPELDYTNFYIDDVILLK